MMITKGFRRRFVASYHQEMSKAAIAHTRQLNRQADRLGIRDDKLTIEVHGELRAQAYMKIGWHPLTETYEKQVWGPFDVQVPIYTLQIERWN